MSPGWLRVCQSGETLTMSGCSSHSLLITALLLFGPTDRFYWLPAFCCFPVSAPSQPCLLLCPSPTCLLLQLPATHSRRCLFRRKADRLDLPSCMKHQPRRTQIVATHCSSRVRRVAPFFRCEFVKLNQESFTSTGGFSLLNLSPYQTCLTLTNACLSICASQA